METKSLKTSQIKMVTHAKRIKRNQKMIKMSLAFSKLLMLLSEERKTI